MSHDKLQTTKEDGRWDAEYSSENLPGCWWGVYDAFGQLVALAPLKETADDIFSSLFAPEWRDGVVVKRRSDLDGKLS